MLISFKPFQITNPKLSFTIYHHLVQKMESDNYLLSVQLLIYISKPWPPPLPL